MPIDIRAAQREEAERQIVQVKSDAAAAANVRAQYHSTETAVKVPAQQAMITGIFVAAPAGIFAAVLALVIYSQVAGGLYFAGFAVAAGVFFSVGLVVWSTIQAVVWIILLQDWRVLVWKIEVALGIDLNRDGQTGQPPAKSFRIEQIKHTRTGAQELRVMVPGEWAAFIDLCRALYNGGQYNVPFTEERWGGAGRLYSQKQFRAVQDAFERLEWAAKRNPEQKNSAVALTRPGQAAIKFYALNQVEPVEDEYEIVPR